MTADFPDLGLEGEVASRAPLCSIVAERLREAILSGRLPVGAEIPSELSLAEKLGVSRPTVREAVRMLQAQGLLTGGDSISTKRPRVTSSNSVASAADAMTCMLRLRRVPLHDLVELRVQVEGAAFVEAARRRDPAALASAQEALAVMERADVSLPEFESALLDFHRSLVQGSGNAAFVMVFDALYETIRHYLDRALETRIDPDAFVHQGREDHRLFLALVESGRGEEARDEFASRIRGFYARMDLPET